MNRSLFIAVVLMATSCAPTYIPNLRNSPMFTGKGEVQLNAQVGNGYNAQGAWAISENFGVIANYSYLKRTIDSDNPQDYRKHTIGEAGLGYFKNYESMFFEIFAGYGEGQGYSDDSYFFSTSSTFASGNYKRYFIQPAFGLNKKRMFVSFVPRISIVDYTEFAQGSNRFVVNEDPSVFFEPAVIGRVNFDEHVYFTFQGGFSVPVSGEPFFEYRLTQFGMGLGLRFGGRSIGEAQIERSRQ
jgi:hypothetical protein